MCAKLIVNLFVLENLCVCETSGFNIWDLTNMSEI